jgi:hypothetical protein
MLSLAAAAQFCEQLSQDPYQSGDPAIKQSAQKDANKSQDRFEKSHASLLYQGHASAGVESILDDDLQSLSENWQSAWHID